MQAAWDLPVRLSLPGAGVGSRTHRPLLDLFPRGIKAFMPRAMLVSFLAVLPSRDRYFISSLIFSAPRNSVVDGRSGRPTDGPIGFRNG